jgi:hypothetical protein
MMAFLAVLRVCRAAIGLFAMINLMEDYANLSKPAHIAANDATLTYGLLLLVAFAVARWLINIPYVRITGMPGISRFWNL